VKRQTIARPSRMTWLALGGSVALLLGGLGLGTNDKAEGKNPGPNTPQGVIVSKSNTGSGQTLTITHGGKRRVIKVPMRSWLACQVDQTYPECAE
jgi:hypothetical protein